MTNILVYPSTKGGTSIDIADFFVYPNTNYFIPFCLDLSLCTGLSNGKLLLPENCTLHFLSAQSIFDIIEREDDWIFDNTQSNDVDNLLFSNEFGLIQNGIIVGNNSRIINNLDIDENSLHRIIFRQVCLENRNESLAENDWFGECRDIWFDYIDNLNDISSTQNNHFDIVRSVCHFQRCVFSRRDYYLKWERIFLHPTGCAIYGNGATFFLPSYKGVIDNDGWNDHPRYQIQSLFEKDAPNELGHEYIYGDKSGELSVSNLTICDNANTIDLTGFGDDVTQFKIYSIFCGSGCYVSFENVRYDGCGGLWTDYNYRTNIKEVNIEGCDVKTTQFAFEIGVLFRDDLIHLSPLGGHCERIIVRNSRIYNYKDNLFVGPLSFVSSGNSRASIINELLIDNCYFESETEKNLEILGARKAVIKRSHFLSVQCSSELIMDSSGMPINQELIITGNYFGISNHLLPVTEDNYDGLRIMCNDLVFTNNSIIFDFAPGILSNGSTLICGNGNSRAVLENNRFLFKGVTNDSFKSTIFYKNVLMSLKNNEYLFLDELFQPSLGHCVYFGGEGAFFNNEIEDDIRFRSLWGGDATQWEVMPPALCEEDGALTWGSRTSSSRTLTAPSIEFDFKAFVDDNEDDCGVVPFMSFESNIHEVDIPCEVSLYFDGEELSVHLDSNVFQSGKSLPFSNPVLDYNSSSGTELGLFRIVFWNNPSNNLTQVLLFFKDWLMDSLNLGCNILVRDWTPEDESLAPPVISSISLYGTRYFRIKEFRAREYGRIIPFADFAPQPFPKKLI